MRKSQLPWSWSRPKINSYKIFLRHSVDISLCGPCQTAVSALPSLGQVTELISWVTEEVIHILVRFKASVLMTKACDSNALLGCTTVTPWWSLGFLSWALFHHLCAWLPELGFLKELFVNVVLLTSSLTLQLAPYLACALRVQSWVPKGTLLHFNITTRGCSYPSSASPAQLGWR